MPPISIHALLAESDSRCLAGHGSGNHFYPRSPCGERRQGQRIGQPPAVFLSTLSLRRATQGGHIAAELVGISIHALLAESDTDTIRKTQRPYVISIHALLAESDRHWQMGHSLARQFLSTLSLRRATSSLNADSGIRVFLSTLSLRRATGGFSLQTGDKEFLSTLSLRRATRKNPPMQLCHSNFYPRSPCGERPEDGYRASRD